MKETSNVKETVYKNSALSKAYLWDLFFLMQNIVAFYLLKADIMWEVDKTRIFQTESQRCIHCVPSSSTFQPYDGYFEKQRVHILFSFRLLRA